MYITYRYGALPTDQKITVCGSSIWRLTCGNSIVDTWILPDIEPADTGGRFGICLEWVKETSMYRIFCECGMAYIGKTGFCIEASTTDSSNLNMLAVVEHGMNILLKDKCVLARKNTAT